MTTQRLGIAGSESRREGATSRLGLRFPCCFRPQSALCVSSPVQNKPNLGESEIVLSRYIKCVCRKNGPSGLDQKQSQSNPISPLQSRSTGGSRWKPGLVAWGTNKPNLPGPCIIVNDFSVICYNESGRPARAENKPNQSQFPRRNRGLAGGTPGLSRATSRDLEPRRGLYLSPLSRPRRWRGRPISPIMPRLSTLRRTKNG